jgi:membrane-associated phospholipid phosphatase
MQLHKKFPGPLNPYFFYPFLAWIVCGGILLTVFDRRELFYFINSRHNAVTDVLMYRITWMGQGEVIIPVLLLMMAFTAYRNWWYFTTALACSITPLIVQKLLKIWIDSPRPLNYFNHAPWIHISSDWPVLLNFSFPSGHSEGAFSFFCFLSLLLKPHHRRYGLLFFILALSVCYSRVYLAAHFFADIYAGSIIGGSVTMLVFVFMSKYKKRFFKEKGTFA